MYIPTCMRWILYHSTNGWFLFPHLPARGAEGCYEQHIWCFYGFLVLLKPLHQGPCALFMFPCCKRYLWRSIELFLVSPLCLGISLASPLAALKGQSDHIVLSQWNKNTDPTRRNVWKEVYLVAPRYSWKHAQASDVHIEWWDNRKLYKTLPTAILYRSDGSFQAPFLLTSAHSLHLISVSVSVSVWWRVNWIQRVWELFFWAHSCWSFSPIRCVWTWTKSCIHTHGWH